MLKAFISQPMNGKTDEEIIANRNKVIEMIKLRMDTNEEIQIIDSFMQGAHHESKPLWFLGKALQMMSDADVVWFGKGWKNARGCVIEHYAAEAYGIQTCYEYDPDDPKYFEV